MHMVSSAPEPFRPLRRVEYDQLVALGTFEGERIELIGGALRRMSPIGPPHTSTVDRLTRLLVLALADLAWVRVQGSFAADELSEPEPDFSIFPLGDYDDRHPSEAHLIVEVSDSSLPYDRGEKAQLYASCGVPEYWIVNLVDRVVEVHREPGTGGYGLVTTVPKGGRLRLLAFPEIELAVDDFLR
jgi:Uma2 family endonuclease